MQAQQDEPVGRSRSPESDEMKIGRVLRLGGSVALLVAGLIHVDLYFGGYRRAGSEPNFGRGVLLNAIASGLVAAAVAARREWFGRLAGIAVPAITLALLGYTHSGHTFLGFQGDGFQPSPQAQIVIVAEIAAIVLLASTFLPSIATSDKSSGVPFLGAAIAVAAITLIAFAVYWANHYDTTAVASAPASVSIADFGFAPQTVTVSQGMTVTWTNNDPFEHSIVASDESFTSGNLGNGATFQFTFDTPGQFVYICGVHPSMTGTVTVAS
jgi:plastocyanin